MLGECGKKVSIPDWPFKNSPGYLSSIEPGAMEYDGTENGLYGTADGVHVYAANVTRAALAKRYPISAVGATESWAFRANGGPSNLMTRLLDPETESVTVAKARLRRWLRNLVTSHGNGLGTYEFGTRMSQPYGTVLSVSL